MGSTNVTLMFLYILVLIGFVRSDVSQDRKECTPQLVGLAPCLPYVGGTGKTPTPGCCTGLEQVLTKSKKCLCVLVRDRNDPSLGFKINATLALSLPSMCKSAATVADCPALLNLPPNSTEAQVFNQFDKSLHGTPPTSGGSPTSANVGAPNKSSGGMGKRWLGVDMVFGVSLLCLTSILVMGIY